MSDPFLSRIAELPKAVFGMEMGIWFSIPVSSYDLAGKFVVFTLASQSDPNLVYTANSDGDYITLEEASEENPNMIQIRIPWSQFSGVASTCRTAGYSIDVKPDASSDPDFRLQGEVIWSRKTGAIND